MNDLHAWLSEQHHGLRTFQTFQHKLETLGRHDPAQRGLCRLLSGIVGSYVETFDEAPLPVEVAEGAYRRLLNLVERIDLQGDAARAASPTSTAWRLAICGSDRQDARFTFQVARRASTLSRRLTPES